MSSVGDQRYLAYIDESIGLIERRTQLGFDAFHRDLDMRDAVLWRLESLAEATGKLSADLKQRHPEIPWRAIYGFRNIAAHAYLDLNLDLIWEIVEVHLPVLKSVISQELGH